MVAVAPQSHQSRLRAWVKALRLQFYPMTWLAYTMGALGAEAVIGNWNQAAFWFGYSVPFFLEAATVLINELFDYESDRRNLAFSPFNGGSRVLVTRALSKTAIMAGIAVTVGAAVLCGVALVSWLEVSLALPVLLAAMLVLGPGYTLPPLKLAWRGLGEPDVALTHSFAAVLWGYLIQGGDWNDPFPWIVSIPMFLALLVAILVTGLPDLEADRSAGKMTQVVKLGRRRTALLALTLTLIAPLTVMVLGEIEALHGAFRGLLPPAAAHALLLAALLGRYYFKPVEGRIDGLLILTLAFTLWFTLVPIINFL